MLALFRSLANTWLARLFFFALAAAFVGWGVSGRSGMLGGGLSGNDVATVSGRTVTEPELQQEVQMGMRRLAQQFPDPAQLPPGLRQMVVNQSLARLVTQRAIDAEVDRLGLVVPREARDAAVTEMPAFQDPGGKFSRNIYLTLLQNNNLSEQTFLREVSSDIAKNQLLGPIQANVRPSDVLTGLIYSFFNEARTVDEVRLPFAGQPQPAAPADAVLQRFYTNNAARYTAPEYRRVKVVILSPETIGRTLPITEADMRAWLAQHRSEFEADEKRSLQVITADNADIANALAAQWRGGASWAQMQQAAKARGASASELTDTTARGVPSPELARAAFAAAPGTVVGPLTEPLGVQILKVTGVTPAKHADFDALKDTIRSRLGAERAADLIDARSQKLQDLFAGGSHIDEVPADLGAAGVEGTLDALGNTPDGTPAPIPGSAELRQKIIADAFKAHQGDPVELTEGPDHAWYAIAVQSITKPALKPFDQVRTQVLADWRADQIRHAQETEAAKLLGLVRHGESLQQAAWGSGLAVTRTPPLHRNRPTPGVPAEVSQAAFAMAPGQAQMIETNEGFIVAALATVTKPDPKADPDGFAQVRGQLTQAMAQETLETFAAALRQQGKLTVNQKLLDQMAQQQGE